MSRLSLKFFAETAETQARYMSFDWKIASAALILGALVIMGPGSGSLCADGVSAPPVRGGDSRQFAAELQSRGEFKFYDDTEELLRAGKFEQAYGRYVFLRGHIQGRSVDHSLYAMVNQRLQFLNGQMGLGEVIPEYRPEKVVKKPRRIKQTRPPSPPADQSAKAKEAGSEEKPPEIIIPPAPPEEKGAAPPQEEAKAPAEEAPKPAPPLTFWEKFKRKLKFW
jgi:hypothetical protein|uniref:Uncharacterized protein n=1 Tax=Desulfobacca acetoxidans TaxID=60893 RepID=A0A7C3V503_9BACT